MLNDINGYTRTCGLIGNPVEHTLSPVIHNTLSMVLGKNLAYVPFHVETGRLEDAVKGAFALNLLGINVTVPYKSDVIPYLDDIDPLASNIGADKYAGSARKRAIKATIPICRDCTGPCARTASKSRDRKC